MSIGNFFKVEVLTVTAYEDGQKLEFGFIPEHIRIEITAGDGPIYYSFNGSDDHGCVGSTTLNGFFGFIQMLISRNEIWLRGTLGTETVTVIAWA